MSRSKKSRKPGVGSSGVKKDTTKSDIVPVEKRLKKIKGKPAGNRRNEAKPIVISKQSTEKKDPRIGNKTPIDLGQASAKATKATKATKAQTNLKAKPTLPSVAPIRTIEPEHVVDTDVLMKELESIEQDERLLSILAKQDDDVEISEEDVNFFNAQMDKHQSIREALGLEDEDEDENEEEESAQSNSSEDDLWDKFNNSDLSKFE
ncbi:MAG: Der GTPase-activating protein YihI [Colwellia sp.]|nr:Der GTPase-activating protein YihI [Colwellia sp.]